MRGTGLAAAAPRLVVCIAPGDVRLWFSRELEGTLSRIEVLNAAGKRVDKNDTALSRDDKRQLSTGLLPLEPGVYRVRWRAVSVDTHPTEGSYAFTLKP